MSSGPTSELTPLLKQAGGLATAQTRATFGGLAGLDHSQPPRRGLKRAESQPVFTARHLQLISVSPMIYRRYYMAQGGSMTSSAFNLASATLGAGVLALPHAMYHSGILIGTAELLFVCVCSVYSVFLMVKVATLTDTYTFEELALELIGPFTEKLTSFLIVAFCWGVAVMYVVVMGDFISPLAAKLGLAAYLGRRTAMLLYWLCVMFPLSLAHKINTLRYASIVGSVSSLLLAGALIMKSLDGTFSFRDVPLWRWDTESVSSLCTFLFSFCCQPVVFKVFLEMKGGTLQRISLCATYSMFACTTIYIITGCFGAVAFGANTDANVVSNFAEHLEIPYVQLAYFGTSIAVTMAFPMTIFPTRDSVVLAMGYKDDENRAPLWLSRTVAGLLAFFALVLGMFVPNIRVLFDSLGGICGGSLSFLLPALFALRCGAWTVRDVGVTHVMCTWFILFCGISMCALGTYNSIKNNFL